MALWNDPGHKNRQGQGNKTSKNKELVVTSCSILSILRIHQKMYVIFMIIFITWAAKHLSTTDLYFTLYTGIWFWKFEWYIIFTQMEAVYENLKDSTLS